MSVYAELVRMGMNEADAAKLSEYSHGLVTKADLKELEAALAWKMGTLMVTGLLGATAIFATIVNIVTK
jgi:hypothetical protein